MPTYDEPIPLQQAKVHLRVDDFSDEDDLISGYIIAAREWVESYTGQIYAQRAITETFDCFRYMNLRAWPIVAGQPITVSYLDSNGASATTTAFRLVAGNRPARIVSGISSSWPSVYPVLDAVTVTLTAGYAAADVPARAKQAMLLLISHWYRNRDAVTADKNEAPVTVPLGVESLCAGLRAFAV